MNLLKMYFLSQTNGRFLISSVFQVLVLIFPCYQKRSLEELVSFLFPSHWKRNPVCTFWGCVPIALLWKAITWRLITTAILVLLQDATVKVQFLITHLPPWMECELGWARWPNLSVIKTKHIVKRERHQLIYSGCFIADFIFLMVGHNFVPLAGMRERLFEGF